MTDRQTDKKQNGMTIRLTLCERDATKSAGITNNIRLSAIISCFQCFDAVGWAAGMPAKASVP